MKSLKSNFLPFALVYMRKPKSKKKVFNRPIKVHTNYVNDYCKLIGSGLVFGKLLMNYPE